MKFAPSILSADFARIAQDIATVEAAGAAWLHLDTMDGRFVPNITWGPKIVKDLRKLTTLTFDAHLMIVEPERYVAEFRDAGCDVITFHLEATVHAQRLLAHVRSLGAKAGVSINPQTPVSALEHLIDDMDVMLIMGVNPGFGGQKYIPETDRKIAQARALIDERNPACILELDGGANRHNVASLARAGVDVCVVGSAVYGAQDPARELRELESMVDGLRGPRR